MTDSEIFVESKDYFKGNKKHDSFKLEDFENLDYQNEMPYWERKFVKMIEQMRTIPYVSLGHFQFINVNWLDESLEENAPIVKKVVVEENDKSLANHWELVKKLIFSNEKFSKDKSVKDQSNVDDSSTSVRDKKSQHSLKHRKSISYQFNNVYNYFRHFVQSKRSNKSKKRETIDDEQSFDGSDKKSKRSIFKNSKILSRNKLRFKKIFNRKRSVEKTKSSKSRKQKTSPDLFKQNKLMKGTLDRRQTLRRTLGKRKDFLLDLTEMSKKKRFYKLNLMMGRDDGPFMTDYRFLLGIDFWTDYCGVEKYQLISVCSSNFWLNEMTSFTSATLRDLKTGKLTKNEPFKLNRDLRSMLKELKKFLEGTNKPAKAPQRVISSEEKFRLIPYPKLFNPNTDLKKTFHSNTMRDQLNKTLRKLYTSIVFLIGGKYPIKRQVGYEEAYEDILLWVLDTYQAKTRFIAITNDQINFEIN